MVQRYGDGVGFFLGRGQFNPHIVDERSRLVLAPASTLDKRTLYQGYYIGRLRMFVFIVIRNRNDLPICSYRRRTAKTPLELSASARRVGLRNL